ncbi:MAG: hypothetical protein ACOWWO_03705, partial [Peptococcaceae bacterium]
PVSMIHFRTGMSPTNIGNSPAGVHDPFQDRNVPNKYREHSHLSLGFIKNINFQRMHHAVLLES